MDEVKRDAALIDLSKASPMERAILMCIERIDVLEERNNRLESKTAEIERRAEEIERRARILLNLGTIGIATGSDVYSNIFAYLLGVPSDRPDMVPNMQEDSDCLAFFELRGDLGRDAREGKLARALELHQAVFPGLRPIWEGCSDSYRAVWDVTTKYSVARLIEMLTLEELDGFWEWRLKYTRWC